MPRKARRRSSTTNQTTFDPAYDYAAYPPNCSRGPPPSAAIRRLLTQQLAPWGAFGVAIDFQRIDAADQIGAVATSSKVSLHSSLPPAPSTRPNRYEGRRTLTRDRKFVDSPLEGDGFELLVPRHKSRGFRVRTSCDRTTGVVLRGTKSLLTHRWRGVDSNRRFLSGGAASAVCPIYEVSVLHQAM